MTRSRLGWLLVVGGVLIWVVAVLPAYYVVHKPFIGVPASSPAGITFDPLDMIGATAGRLVDIGLLLLTIGVAAAWGCRITRWLGITFESGLEEWTLAASLGLGLLGSVVLALGAVGGLYRWAAYLLLAVLGLPAISETRSLLRCAHAKAMEIRSIRPHWSGLYVGLIGLLALGLALLPPTSWDALVYHLTGPRLYVQAHRLIAVPENLYLNWPGQVEMLFTWGLLLKGDTLAKLFHWIFWPLTAVLTYLLGRRIAGQKVGRWAAVLWASVPFAAELAAVAYVDLALTAFVLAGVYAFLQWADSQSDGWLWLSALFLGLALASKYTAAVWLGLLLLVLLYHSWRHHGKTPHWVLGRALCYAMIAVLPVIPWLLKNWIIVGNPVYPLLYGGAGWNATRHHFLTGSGGGYSHHVVDYLALPWVATVLGISGTAAFDATTGPLLLLLVPFVFLIRRRSRWINFALVLVAGQATYFVATIYQYVYLAETRLLLPIFPLLSVVGGYALAHLPDWDRKTLRLSRVIAAVVVLVLVVSLLTQVHSFFSTKPLAPLLGLESRDSYLTRRLGAHYEAMSYSSQRLAAGSRVFFLWEPRSYYNMLPSQPDATLDNLVQLRLAYGDAGTALVALRGQGFTHLLYYRAGLAFLQAPSPRPPSLTSLLNPVSTEKSYYPLSNQDLDFLEDLLRQCRLERSLGAAYEIHQIL